MEYNRASVTSLITAFIRAYHATHDPDPIFDDRLAAQLFTEAEHAAFSKNLAMTVGIYDPETAATHPDEATALAAVVRAQSIPLCRGRYAEDCLRDELAAGLRQYVLLGAGLDTFALRMPASARDLAVIEVDHPATQADKRERLARWAGELPPQLHFLPVDFTQENLDVALRRSPYDPNARGFFSWLGVSYYLPLEAVLTTLQAVSAIAREGSTLIFDYMVPDSCLSEWASQRAERIRQVTQRVGEPFVTTFEPTQLVGQLARLGLHLQEDLSAADIRDRYLSGRIEDMGAFEQLRFARAVVGRKSR
jgi:methyltransferase (TIGR00027 family)